MVKMLHYQRYQQLHYALDRFALLIGSSEFDLTCFECKIRLSFFEKETFPPLPPRLACFWVIPFTISSSIWHLRPASLLDFSKRNSSWLYSFASDLEVQTYDARKRSDLVSHTLNVRSFDCISESLFALVRSKSYVSKNSIGKIETNRLGWSPSHREVTLYETFHSCLVKGFFGYLESIAAHELLREFWQCCWG